MLPVNRVATLLSLVAAAHGATLTLQACRAGVPAEAFTLQNGAVAAADGSCVDFVGGVLASGVACASADTFAWHADGTVESAKCVARATRRRAARAP